MKKKNQKIQKKYETNETHKKYEIETEGHVCPHITNKNNAVYYKNYKIPKGTVDYRTANLFLALFKDAPCKRFLIPSFRCSQKICEKCVLSHQNRSIFGMFLTDMSWNPQEGDSVWKIKYNSKTYKWTYAKGSCSHFNAIMSRYGTIFRTREQARIACKKLNILVEKFMQIKI